MALSDISRDNVASHYADQKATTRERGGCGSFLQWRLEAATMWRMQRRTDVDGMISNVVNG